MKRNVYILTLISLFFISTTGLPITLQICGMSNSSAIKTCDMCKTHHNPIKVSINDSDCCQYKVIDNKITDRFLVIAKDKDVKSGIKVILTSGNVVYQSPSYLTYNLYTSSSPPPISDNHIYLINSILLI